MTSVATIVGYFPLILATGAGAASRNSIGLVLVGGMAVGTLFTLLVIPSIYMLIARERKQAAVAAAEPEALAAACILPQSSEFKIPVGCSLVAEDDCQWTIDCNSPQVIELKRQSA
jgi:predicted RND superfamily exporter protein